MSIGTWGGVFLLGWWTGTLGIWVGAANGTPTRVGDVGSAGPSVAAASALALVLAAWWLLRCCRPRADRSTDADE